MGIRVRFFFCFLVYVTIGHKSTPESIHSRQIMEKVRPPAPVSRAKVIVSGEDCIRTSQEIRRPLISKLIAYIDTIARRRKTSQKAIERFVQIPFKRNLLEHFFHEFVQMKLKRQEAVVLLTLVLDH
jgi:hypothetical protein